MFLGLFVKKNYKFSVFGFNAILAPYPDGSECNIYIYAFNLGLNLLSAF